MRGVLHSFTGFDVSSVLETMSKDHASTGSANQSTPRKVQEAYSYKFTESQEIA